jgi:(E)-4-hydroxy-3-methylbut-2-enyl-diphosphate synthase
MREALVVSALESAERAAELGLGRDRIVISCKVSGVQDLIAVYREPRGAVRVRAAPGPDRGRHGLEGIVASTPAWRAAAGRHRRHDPRLADAGAERRSHAGSDRGAGDPADAGTALVRADGDRLPGCGRTTSTYFQELAQKIQTHIRHQMPQWRKQYVGRRGHDGGGDGLRRERPGESKHANIGISLPGTGERPGRPGLHRRREGPTLKGEHIAEEFQSLVEDYVAKHYARKESA